MWIAATSITLPGRNPAPCSMAFIRISRKAIINSSRGASGKPVCSSVRNAISRSALRSRELIRREIQLRCADSTSIPTSESVVFAACAA